MLEKCILCLLILASTPSCGAVDACQNADGQIWKGVFHSKCQKDGKYEDQTEIGPYCTVEAKVHGNSTWFAFTDISYGACSAIHKTVAVGGTAPGTYQALVQNLTQLIASTPKMTAPGTNCTAGELIFSSPAQVVLQGQNVSVKAEGYISTSGLDMNTSFDLKMKQGAWFRYTCESFWKFFAPPRTPPVKGAAIQSRETGLCLDLPGGDVTSGNKLWLWECLGNKNQMWNFVDGQLVYGGSTGAPKCVDLYEGSTSNGVQLEIGDCARTPQQQWGFDTTTGTIYLATRVENESLKCMDLRNGGADGKNIVQLWDCYYGAWNQQWILHGSNGIEKQPKRTEFVQVLV